MWASTAKLLAEAMTKGAEMTVLVEGLLWFAAVSAGVMAGIYFTFSAFAMRSFAALGEEHGARAMQSINRVILQSSFLPLFMLSSLVCAALVGLALMGLAGPARVEVLAGGALYVIGMFVVTAAGNVPLNNRLDAADPSSAEGRAVWADYLLRWTRLNHVRTIACTFSCILLVRALIVI